LYRKSIDFTVTLILWVYFIFGFLILYLPRYLAALGAADREAGFQRLNHLFFSRFFSLVRILVPSLSIEIEPAVRNIRSAVIVCNHISYLDPLLLIALYEKQKTIVKATFFSAPIFGWAMTLSGYVPATGKSVSPWQALDRLRRLGEYLAGGGNVFVFPEGTRSKTGRIGELSAGAFRVALKSGAPVKVLFVENSNRLFAPGRFLFNTGMDRPIRLRLLATIAPETGDPGFDEETLKKRVKELLDAANG